MRVKNTFYRQNNFNKNDKNDENIVYDFYNCAHISTHDIIYGNISNNNNCNINIEAINMIIILKTLKTILQ